MSSDGKALEDLSADKIEELVQGMGDGRSPDIKAGRSPGMGAGRSPKDDDFRSFLQSFVDKNRKIKERRKLAARQPFENRRQPGRSQRVDGKALENMSADRIEELVSPKVKAVEQDPEWRQFLKGFVDKNWPENRSRAEFVELVSS